MDKILALYRRFLWESKDIVWIYTNQVEKLFASRAAYMKQAQMAELDLDASMRKELDALIVSATLASESQVERDMWGWTVRLPFKPWGMFCGVEPEGTVCARLTRLGAEAKKDPVGSFAIQRVSTGAPVRQTSLIPRDTSSLYLVEQYFDESEQLPARIAIGDGEAVMALSMPNAKWDEVASLSQADLLALYHKVAAEFEEAERESQTVGDGAEGQSEAAPRITAQFAAAKGPKTGVLYGDLKLMHEAVFYYGCRCDVEQMRQMVSSLPKSQQDELWHGVDHLDIECPRCGRNYRIER